MLGFWIREAGILEFHARRLHSLGECPLPRTLEQVMISLQVFYEGHVQGVGFRFTVRDIAKGFDVTGWVRNLPDGRVELQVTGDDDEVRAFLDQVAQSELDSLIRKQTENKLNERVAARGFAIRHD